VKASTASSWQKRPLPVSGSAWQEVRYSFSSTTTDGQATVEIAAAGNGGYSVGFHFDDAADSRKNGMLRRDLVEALRGLKPPFIRWPGGSFASTYKWKDGIGPQVSPEVPSQHDLGRVFRLLWLRYGRIPGTLSAAQRRAADRPRRDEHGPEHGAGRHGLGALPERSADDGVGQETRGPWARRTLSRQLLPDRQRADELRSEAEQYAEIVNLYAAGCGRLRRMQKSSPVGRSGRTT